MTELLTAAQMRSIEMAAIDSGDVTGLELMERAGSGVVSAIFAHWPDLAATPHRAVVLCGPGNNGGDGYVVARLLKDWGWDLRVVALAASVTPDAGKMRARWEKIGGVLAPDAVDWPDFRGAAVVVDAMYGSGLARDIAPGVWGLLAMAVSSGCRVVAVDILSGICADSGRIRAQGGFLDWPVDLTVSFERAKLGHYLGEGAGLSGPLRVVPIGLDRQMDALLRREGDAVVDLASVSGADLGKDGGHKFAHGHAVVLSGGAGQGGAARLAARAALRIGAGLVTVGCPAGAMAENAARLDAVMLRALAGPEELSAMLSDHRINALCVGPGIGLDERSAELVRVVLSARVGVKPRPTVLDADALTLIARDPSLFDLLHPACVLTPHAGEFARLFPDIAAALEAQPVAGAAFSKVDACRAAAARAGCVVLFKGADTVIANPFGRCAVSSALRERAAPWLATAGSGDVLSGFVAGLLARGFDPFNAAQTAAWLHVECARSFGPGLIAEDLADELPKVFRSIGL